MPTVLNFYALGKTIPPGAVYIGRGRGGIWGNPFSIGRDGDRDEVIRKHRAWLLASSELIARARVELAGKDLVCFCAPRACHGDTLMKLANPRLTLCQYDPKTGGGMGLRDALDDEHRREAEEADRQRAAGAQETLDTETAQRLLDELLSEAAAELRRLQRPLVGLMVWKVRLFGDRRTPAKFVDGGMFWILSGHLLSPEGVLHHASAEHPRMTHTEIDQQIEKLRERARRGRSYPTMFRSLGERVVAASQGTGDYDPSTFHLFNGELRYGITHERAERVIAGWIAEGGD